MVVQVVHGSNQQEAINQIFRDAELEFSRTNQAISDAELLGLRRHLVMECSSSHGGMEWSSHSNISKGATEEDSRGHSSNRALEGSKGDTDQWKEVRSIHL
jgi:hypothetical protein